MPASHDNLFAGLSAESARLAERVRRMAAARWQLAALETREAVRLVRQTSIYLAIAGWMLLSSLPLLVVALAAWCAAWWGISQALAQTIGFLSLVVAGLLLATFGWRRFRRQFVGWEESLAELREDLQWLREWQGQPSESAESNSPSADDWPFDDLASPDEGPRQIVH